MWLTFGAQTWELRDGEVVVGSGADADWRVATADLMPRHFTIVVHGLNASLRASSKDNVVVVNDRQLSGASHLLNDGDVIAAGSGRFLFTDGAPRILPPETRNDRAFLIDESEGVVHPLISRSTTLGRDGASSIVVRDPSASRFQAEVRREAGGFALHPTGSAGTILNGRKLGAPVLLSEGDTIEIARASFRFTRTEPHALPVADPGDPAIDAALASPTLATGKFTVVPETRRRGLAAAVVVAVVVVVAVLAVMLAR